MSTEQIENEVARWLDEVVIGLRLCPFAARPRRLGQVDIVVSEARDGEGLLAEIDAKVQQMASTPAEVLDTSLLVIPTLLADFVAYNDFIHILEHYLAACGWEGEFQVASFHPQYCFADAEPDDPANFTNRAPYPIVHFLREASVEAALAGYSDPDEIPQRNIALLRGLSASRLREYFPYL